MGDIADYTIEQIFMKNKASILWHLAQNNVQCCYWAIWKEV